MNESAVASVAPARPALPNAAAAAGGSTGASAAAAAAASSPLCPSVSVVASNMREPLLRAAIAAVSGALKDPSGPPLREVARRIKAADALVALITPHNTPGAVKTPPQWVSDEFTHAKALDKPAIRIVHDDLRAAGMYAADEYIPFNAGGSADTLIKLMRTLALWKRAAGRTMQIEIAASGSELPAEAAQAQECEVQIFADFTEGQWTAAKVWPEPGALYTCEGKTEKRRK